MTQSWARPKVIDDELQPGMARLFASDDSEGNKNPTFVCDKNISEKMKYGNSVNYQESKRTMAKLM